MVFSCNYLPMDVPQSAVNVSVENKATMKKLLESILKGLRRNNEEQKGCTEIQKMLTDLNYLVGFIFIIGLAIVLIMLYWGPTDYFLYFQCIVGMILYLIVILFLCSKHKSFHVFGPAPTFRKVFILTIISFLFSLICNLIGLVWLGILDLYNSDNYQNQLNGIVTLVIAGQLMGLLILFATNLIIKQITYSLKDSIQVSIEELDYFIISLNQDELKNYIRNVSA